MSPKSLTNFAIAFTIMLVLMAMGISSTMEKAAAVDARAQSGGVNVPLARGATNQSRAAVVALPHPTPTAPPQPASGSATSPAAVESDPLVTFLTTLFDSPGLAGKSSSGASPSSPPIKNTAKPATAAADRPQGNQTIDQMVSNLTPEQQQEIAKYSNGRSPSELVNDFCVKIRSADNAQMSENIKNSASDPNADAHSPVLLLQLFDQIAKLCP
jgi:hypothetical protein